jgi:hypothetical protein
LTQVGLALILEVSISFVKRVTTRAAYGVIVPQRRSM